MRHGPSSFFGSDFGSELVYFFRVIFYRVASFIWIGIGFTVTRTKQQKSQCVGTRVKSGPCWKFLWDACIFTTWSLYWECLYYLESGWFRYSVLGSSVLSTLGLRYLGTRYLAFLILVLLWWASADGGSCGCKCGAVCWVSIDSSASGRRWRREMQLLAAIVGLMERL